MGKAFLGYLSLGQGIESLPLNFLNDSVSTVDLGLLSASNTTVQPQTNLLTNKMNMSSEKIRGYDYYSGVSGEPVDASKIILTIMTQVSGTDYNNRLYDSPNYGPDVKEDVIATPISLSSIGLVNMAYNDIFGNSLIIEYNHQ